jgi:hypothetical protein
MPWGVWLVNEMRVPTFPTAQPLDPANEREFRFWVVPERFWRSVHTPLEYWRIVPAAPTAHPAVGSVMKTALRFWVVGAGDTGPVHMPDT